MDEVREASVGSIIYFREIIKERGFLLGKLKKNPISPKFFSAMAFEIQSLNGPINEICQDTSMLALILHR